MKYWWDNLDYEEKMTAFAISGMALAIIAITLFFAIPRNEKMKHCKIQGNGLFNYRNTDSVMNPNGEQSTMIMMTVRNTS